MSFEWTERKLAELDRLWRDPACSMADIARLLGTSKNAVAGMGHRRLGARGIKPKRQAPPEPSVPPPAAVPPTPPPARLVPQGVSHRRCQWPLGEPRKPGFRFCEAAPVVPGKPYCADHCARAFVALPSQAALPPSVARLVRPGRVA